MVGAKDSDGFLDGLKFYQKVLVFLDVFVTLGLRKHTFNFFITKVGKMKYALRPWPSLPFSLILRPLKIVTKPILHAAKIVDFVNFCNADLDYVSKQVCPLKVLLSQSSTSFKLNHCSSLLLLQLFDCLDLTIYPKQIKKVLNSHLLRNIVNQ